MAKKSSQKGALFTPIQGLVAGFVLIILIGSFLLKLPIASSSGTSIRFIDAMFTATSAVTTTGLIVVDTGRDYSLFGQIIILILFQIGGLGYMAIITSVVLLGRRRISLNTRELLGESVVRPRTVDVLFFVKNIIIFTFIVELLGGLALSWYWRSYFDPTKSFYEGFFHSVSAFCTAGFSLFSDSMTAYRGSTVFNLIIFALCITGGIGFFVLYDVYSFFAKTITRKRPRQLSAHTKLALSVSVLLMLAGTLLIFISETKDQSVGLFQRLLNAAFQSVSSSTTTGFNTVDVGRMSQTSLLTIIILMFIGGSPGATAGGIKTTTFGLTILSLFAVLTGRDDVNIFRGRVPHKTLIKAFSIVLVTALCLLAATLVLTVTENAAFLDVFFEAASALGTVGLSMGITPQLSTSGKIVIAITMLIGRIGPLAIGFSLIGKPKIATFQYPETEILVG
ncbi:MAG: hypothetical protein JW749_06945 [Sedimentisphaerales bacterium]|nr:hypothetical protein [Sedimentisphaerales bacterium]